jgi:hypothetical protein
MSSLERIKDHLNNTFSDGYRKLPCKINSGTESYPQKGILLFYLNDPLDNEIIALGRETQIGLYSQGVQIAMLHKTYNQCRDLAFEVLEYLNANRLIGIVMIPESGPTYAGINGQRGQHIFIINYKMKGDK